MRLKGLDALRCVAALSVALFHFTNGNQALLPDGHWLKYLGSVGYLGVPMFFAISGFIIPYSMALRGYEVRTGWTGFLVRRILRIEPAYLASVLVAIAAVSLSSAIPGSNARPPNVPFWMVAAHVGYLVPWTGGEWFLPVYWSLAIEFQYYLAMLVFAPLLLSKRAALVRMFLTGTALLSLTGADGRLLMAYLPLFGLGFVAFTVATQRLSTWEALAWGTCFLALGLHMSSDPAVPMVAAASSLVILATRFSGEIPFLNWIGTISYSLYLTHVPIGSKVVNLAVRSDIEIVRVLAVPAALLVSILFAWAFWRIFEVAVPAWIDGRRTSARDTRQHIA